MSRRCHHRQSPTLRRITTTVHPLSLAAPSSSPRTAGGPRPPRTVGAARREAICTSLTDQIRGGSDGPDWNWPRRHAGGGGGVDYEAERRRLERLFLSPD